MAELTGEAWHELSGYDGRILATVRGLLRPGHLTLEYVAGRRAQYLPPLRVYLAVSVLYFVIAAAAPEDRSRPGALVNAGGIQIGISGSRSSPVLTAEERERMAAQVEEAPAVLRPALRSILADPAGVQSRLLATMPRVLFAMLPVFAAIVAVFYRGRRFPVSLVFAAHLHAFAFVALSVAELAKFSGWRAGAVMVSVLVLVSLATYVWLAFSRVYGGSRLAVTAKAIAIGIVYLFASLPFFALMLAWAAM